MHARSRLVPLTILLLLALLCGALPTIGLAQPGQTPRVWLPVIRRGAAASEQLVLDRINTYRALAGAPLLQLHAALVQAAQKHAAYYLRNHADAAAMANGPHGEVANKPGYTGRTPFDRAQAANYPWLAGWEVMHFMGDPVGSVDNWTATVFHRAILLEPALAHLGYGNGISGATRVDVADFGQGTATPERQRLILFPAPAQTNVPLAGAAEFPSALPPGATEPFGYPITIQPSFGVPFAVTRALVRDGSGAAVAVYPNPSGCTTMCYALIPKTPLKPATTYTVEAAGTIDGAPFTRTWSFTTTP
ncbi:MAG TPA: CAP domain-containing protein [Roseiflexaceae bacterium]|nr:CAP domain-containing protein [Roseiflexaceae bacterium]